MNIDSRKSHLFCKKCNVTLPLNSWSGAASHEEHLMYDVTGAKPTCETCETTLTWVPCETTAERKVPHTFDLAFQVFRDADGNAVECESDHFCNRCYGPAKMISISAHGEFHECMNCGNTFTVC